MNFFSNFPTIKYRDRYAPNILASIKLSFDILESVEVYHPFVIPEGDRPDTIAELYYGDPEADWLIYIANNILDINNQWPLTSNQFTQYIIKTYGSYSEANKIKHYNIKRDIPELQQEQFDALPLNMRKYWVFDINKSVYHITDIPLVISKESYAALSAAEKVYWKSETFFNYEFKINEQKRKIRLIDKKYKASLEETLKQILND